MSDMSSTFLVVFCSKGRQPPGRVARQDGVTFTPFLFSSAFSLVIDNVGCPHGFPEQPSPTLPQFFFFSFFPPGRVRALSSDDATHIS